MIVQAILLMWVSQIALLQFSRLPGVTCMLCTAGFVSIPLVMLAQNVMEAPCIITESCTGAADDAKV